MVLTITRKELIVHLVSFRFWVGTLFTIVLASASTVVAARDFEQRQQGFHARQEADQAALRDVTVYSYLQPAAIRPPQALSILAQGLDARSGTDVRIDLFTVPVSASGSARNEFLSWLRTVDLTTLVSVLLGLLALLLMADSVVGERADGSLRLALAHGGSRAALFMGKFLGGLVAVCLPLTGALAVGLFMLHRVAPDGIGAVGWWRIAGVVLAYLVYLSLMVWLGLLISLTAPTAAWALQIAAFVWVLTALVIPSDAVRTAARGWSGTEEARRAATRQQDRRAETRQQLIGQLRRQDPVLRGFSGLWPSYFRGKAPGGVLYRYGSGTYYDHELAVIGFDVSRGRDLADRAFDDHQLVAARWRRADRWGRRFASLSPSFLLNRVAYSIAGTAAEEFDRFLAACREYRQAFCAHLDRQGAVNSWRWFTDDSPERMNPWPTFLGYHPEQIRGEAEARRLFQLLDKDTVAARIEQENRSPSRLLALADLPRFTYRPAGLGESLLRVAPELTLLLTANLLVAWAGWARCQRLERE